MRGTQRFEAGSRFKYTPDSIDFNYENLVNAIGDAIDKQAQEYDNKYVTDAPVEKTVKPQDSHNFDELMNEFNEIIQGIIKSATDEEMQTYWQPRITSITDKHLGRGHKVGNMSREQTEALSLIVEDMRDLVKNK